MITGSETDDTWDEIQDSFAEEISCMNSTRQYNLRSKIIRTNQERLVKFVKIYDSPKDMQSKRKVVVNDSQIAGPSSVPVGTRNESNVESSDDSLIDSVAATDSEATKPFTTAEDGQNDNAVVAPISTTENLDKATDDGMFGSVAGNATAANDILVTVSTAVELPINDPIGFEPSTEIDAHEMPVNDSQVAGPSGVITVPIQTATANVESLNEGEHDGVLVKTEVKPNVNLSHLVQETILISDDSIEDIKPTNNIKVKQESSSVINISDDESESKKIEELVKENERLKIHCRALQSRVIGMLMAGPPLASSTLIRSK